MTPLKSIRAVASRTLPTSFVAAWQVREWERHGCPRPVPPAVKRRAIFRYGRAANLSVLVETGTYQGDTVEAARRHFDKIYSIELNHSFWRRADERFARFPHIVVLHGDSSHLLPQILGTLDRSCLFWLDAHYSGADTARGNRDTPIELELRAILRHHVREHVILIDDAPDFTGDNDYPTVDELRTLVASERPDWVFEVRDDIIRTHSPSVRVT